MIEGDLDEPLALEADGRAGGAALDRASQGEEVERLSAGVECGIGEGHRREGPAGAAGADEGWGIFEEDGAGFDQVGAWVAPTLGVEVGLLLLPGEALQEVQAVTVTLRAASEDDGGDEEGAGVQVSLE